MVTQDEIVLKVKAIMNEIGEESNSSLLDEDTIKIDEYIKSCIGDAVNLVILNSPDKCVNPKKATVQPQKNSDGSGCVILPDDFVSLIAFKMSGWKRIVSKTYPLGSEVAKAQGNEYTRGGINKPVCILSYSSEGKRVLDYYSLPKEKEHAVSIFTYEAAYNESSGLNTEKSEPVFDAICYMTASLVYTIFENPATAKEMQTVAVNFINNAVSH